MICLKYVLVLEGYYKWTIAILDELAIREVISTIYVMSCVFCYNNI
jgi:hypothetical protein